MFCSLLHSFFLMFLICPVQHSSHLMGKMVVGRFVTVYLYVNDFDIAAYIFFLLGPQWGGGL